MNTPLTVIIPVSRYELLATIQNSINFFKDVDFSGFDETIVYAIDVPDDTRCYYQTMEPSENMELLWVHDTTLKQAGAYNDGLREYPNSDYYAFFDIDAIPATDFFQKCARIDADFVSCDRLVSNPYQNRITETIAEEYHFCNHGRKFMHKHIGKFFPASCTGLIRGKVMHNFRFTEKTSADSELYRHLLWNDFSMGYANNTLYMESSPTTLKQLYAQRLRWLSDTWRTCAKTSGSGNGWKENISNLLMYKVGMFPIIYGIIATTKMQHVRGYNMVSHVLYMQYISIIALIKTLKNDDIEWSVSGR